jgi:methoxymalonate biosynthesis acyl carrier protein
MHESSAVERQITRLFLDRLHLEVPSVETDLLATGALDSMGFVELLVSLEERYGIEISLDNVEIDNFRSIRRIAAFVLGHGSVSRPEWGARTAHPRTRGGER